MATDTHLPTLLMATTSLALMLGLQRLAPRLPAVLIAVVVTTLAAWQLDYAGLGGAIVGVIPAGLPALSLPAFEWDTLVHLIGSAITISLIGFMEAISIAKTMAARTRSPLDPNQELIGQGLGNLSAALTAGYPVSGSFSRSAVNLEAGARTGFSSIITGCVVGIALLWLTPLLYHLPQATLGAVIILAVLKLIKFAPVHHAWRAQRHDGVVALVTFALTLLWAPHLDQGILAGVALSLGLFLYRTMRPRFAILTRNAQGQLCDAERWQLPVSDCISLVRFDGQLYFANAGYFEARILRLISSLPKLRYLIIDAEGINQIDATGEQTLQQLHERLAEHGIVLLFARMKLQARDTLQRTGLYQQVGPEHFFTRITHALDFAWEGLGNDYPRERCPLFHHRGSDDLHLLPT